MEVSYETLTPAAILLTVSLLSVYRPNWVWGKFRAVSDEAARERLVRRHKIGTLVFSSLVPSSS